MAANNRIVWEGLDELRAALRQLPSDLAAEATGIVIAHAEGAAQEIEGAYPARTGNLRNGMDVIRSAAGRFGVGALVRNRAKHAWIFENGTQARHTSLGASRGSMPPGHVFIPRIIRWRARMYDALRAMLERHGLAVSGHERAA